MATDLLTMVAAGSQSMQLQAACAANHDDNHVDGDDGGGHAVDADPSCVTHQPRWRQAFSQSTQLQATYAANHHHHGDNDDRSTTATMTTATTTTTTPVMTARRRPRQQTAAKTAKTTTTRTAMPTMIRRQLVMTTIATKTKMTVAVTVVDAPQTAL